VTARLYTGDPYNDPVFQTYAADSGTPVWIFVLLTALFMGMN
jgi:hypothetical protein